MTRAHILAGLALFLLGFLLGREWRDRSADLAEAKVELAAVKDSLTVVQDARQAESEQGQALAEIGADHEQDRQAAEAVPAAVVADLRNGNLRLREHWAACETRALSEAAAGAVERDEAARLREQGAADLVRIGRDADDQVRACQRVIAEYLN